MAKKAKAKKAKAKKIKAGLTVGIMHSGSAGSGATPGPHDKNIKAFKDALEAQYGQAPNYNGPLWADDKPGNLNHNAQALVNAGVQLLVAAGGTASAGWAKANTTTIPIVFTSVTDSTIAVPNPGVDRNMTGVCARTSGLDAARLKLLHELFPQATQFGALFNSQRPNYTTHPTDLNGTAVELGLDPLVERAVDPNATASIKSQIDQAYQAFQSCAAVLVTADPLFNNHRQDVLRTGPGHAAPLRTPPAIYQWREFAEEGGLVSYGPNLLVAYQVAGIQAARILQQLPVAAGAAIKYPTVSVLNSFELIINLQTATTGWATVVDIPDTLLSRADEIIV
jgi:putative ABC transport system substrate-binding protein